MLASHDILVDHYLMEPFKCYSQWIFSKLMGKQSVSIIYHAKLSQCYLMALPASAPSEQLHSGDDEIYNEKKE